MFASRVVPRVLAALLAGLCAAPLAAQVAGPLPDASRGPSQAATRIGIGPATRSGPNDQPVPVVQGADGKVVLLAAGLSAVVPGVGSLYAGNAKHGWTHLLVHLGSSSVLFVGMVDCLTDWEGGCSNENVYGLTALAFAVNWAWSIVSAVNDAGAFNRR